MQLQREILWSRNGWIQFLFRVGPCPDDHFHQTPALGFAITEALGLDVDERTMIEIVDAFLEESETVQDFKHGSAAFRTCSIPRTRQAIREASDRVLRAWATLVERLQAAHQERDLGGWLWETAAARPPYKRWRRGS